MFLIAKIVRGRRLLLELEQQEKDEAAAALEAVNNISQVSKRLAARRRTSKLDADDTDEATSSAKSERRKSTRRKTHTCGSIDSSLDPNERLTIRRTSSMPSIVDVAPDVVAGTAKHYNYGDKLNRMQRRALRFTWHRLQTRNGGKRVENVFEEVFDRLVRALPSVRDMFATRMFLCAMSRNDTASLRDHAKVTVKMFDVALKNMDAERNKRTDTGSKLDPRIIGSQHGLLRPYGLTGQYWEKLGETIIDVVLGQEAVRDLPGAGQAWVIFTACLVDQLRAGFEESRSTGQMYTKREAVLHYATKHLYETDPLAAEGSIASDANVSAGPNHGRSNESEVAGPSSSHMPSTSSQSPKIVHQESIAQQTKRKSSKLLSKKDESTECSSNSQETMPTSSRRMTIVDNKPPPEICLNKD